MIRSVLLTTIQFLSIGALLFTNRWFVLNPFLLLIQVAGIILAIWSIIEMSKSKLNITPDIREGSVLISSGPYRFIRHPMYLSLLLALLPILSENHSLTNILIFLVLFINLIFKLSYEETLLKSRFKRYVVYSENTWRLIPWVY